jgi:hypothetical protein
VRAGVETNWQRRATFSSLQRAKAKGAAILIRNGKSPRTDRDCVRPVRRSNLSRRSQTQADAKEEEPIGARVRGKRAESFQVARAGGRAVAGASHAAALRERRRERRAPQRRTHYARDKQSETFRRAATHSTVSDASPPQSSLSPSPSQSPPADDTGSGRRGFR